MLVLNGVHDNIREEYLQSSIIIRTMESSGRCIEKLEFRLAKDRTTRTFNLRCLQEKVIPSGCRIKFISKNNFAWNIIRKAELQLVNNRVRDYHNKIKHLGNDFIVRKIFLKNSINNDRISAQIEQFLFQSKEKI